MSGSEFIEIASELSQILNNRVFVAHRVGFDLKFIASEFKRCAVDWKPCGILCTVELSKQFFPNWKSHSLSTLSKTASFKNPRPHRALPNAQTAAAFILYLKSRFGSGVLQNVLQNTITDLRSDKPELRDMIKKLPEDSGVYYMIDRYNRPIYIGKAKNIRSRIKSHFSGTDISSNLIKGHNEIKNIKHVITGNELFSAILEDHEIRKYWPIYNRAQKLPVYKYTIRSFIDGSGVWRIAVAKSIRQLNGDHYYSKGAAINKIKEHVVEFGLDPCYCGLTDKKCLSVSVHNTRFKKFINESITSKPIYKALIGDGRSKEENHVILFKDSKLYGIGYTKKRPNKEVKIETQQFIRINSSLICENIIENAFSKSEVNLISLEPDKIKIPSSIDNGITPNFNLVKSLF